MDFITIAYIVAAASSVLIALLVIPCVRAALTAQRRARTAELARVYVLAAEQIYGSGHGKDKYDYVTRALAARGIKINRSDDTDEIRALIESGVRELKYME